MRIIIAVVLLLITIPAAAQERQYGDFTFQRDRFTGREIAIVLSLENRDAALAFLCDSTSLYVRLIFPTSRAGEELNVRWLVDDQEPTPQFSWANFSDNPEEAGIYGPDWISGFGLAASAVPGDTLWMRVDEGDRGHSDLTFPLKGLTAAMHEMTCGVRRGESTGSWYERVSSSFVSDLGRTIEFLDSLMAETDTLGGG